VAIRSVVAGFMLARWGTEQTALCNFQTASKRETACRYENHLLKVMSGLKSDSTEEMKIKKEKDRLAHLLPALQSNGWKIAQSNGVNLSRLSHFSCSLRNEPITRGQS